MRRPLHHMELRLVLWSMELLGDGSLEPDAILHAARVTWSGKLVFACDMAQTVYESGAGYYLLPFLTFILDNAPMCATCKMALYTEGVIGENKQNSLATN